MKLQLVEISGTTREIDLVPTKIVGIGVKNNHLAAGMVAI